MPSLSVSAAAVSAPKPSAGYFRITSVAFWGVHVAAVVGVIY